jgi:hypothetical protein
MRTTITLDFNDVDIERATELSNGVDVGVLLRDALGEFIATRTPIDKYVAERYRGQYSGFLTYKIRDLAKRC